MWPTYKATLHGDRIEWDDAPPDAVRNSEHVEVYVTFIDPEDVEGEGRGRLMAEALERVAATGGVSSISDAAEWQDEQRQERALPDRS